MTEFEFEDQFKWGRKDWLKKMDFINWFRFFYITKDILEFSPEKIIEVGEGSGIVKNILKDVVLEYKTIDITDKMKPDFVSDIRNKIPELNSNTDCLIAADILEHIPFDDLDMALTNICGYLKENGRAYITIPHRASYFLFMDPRTIPFVLRVPTGFCSLGSFYRRFIKRKIWIDPGHEWETGDGKHKISDVEEKFKKAGFKMLKRKTLLYVDFWILEKFTRP